MSRLIIIDASPLAHITNPRTSPANGQCKAWLESLQRAAELHTVFLALVGVRRHWREPDHDGALTALAREAAGARREVSGTR